MRKKSHISLAKYIVDSLEEQELVKHKKAFYLGSILPDCKPSFFTEKHEIEGTFPKFQEELKELVERQLKDQVNQRVFYRNLGEAIHYVADYFTFPHNAHYTGSLKDHCIYEKHLKKGLREYIRSGEAEKNREAWEPAQGLDSIEAICDYIQSHHEAYVKLKNTVEGDCRQIVVLCQQVVEAVILLTKAEEFLQAA
ncbi:MAG: zinc dependent phospholipase C family protein [Lachnospiraceae bacterium]|jgi:hypothetical protein|nr:zinc dependent phospholipase C family protein [Lachnospiraceae bacterium]